MDTGTNNHSGRTAPGKCSMSTQLVHLLSSHAGTMGAETVIITVTAGSVWAYIGPEVAHLLPGRLDLFDA